MVCLNVFVDLMDLTIIECLHLTHVLWVCESRLLVFTFEILFSPPRLLLLHAGRRRDKGTRLKSLPWNYHGTCC